MSSCVVQIFHLPHEDARWRDSEDNRYAYTVTSLIGAGRPYLFHLSAPAKPRKGNELEG
jgi:hypothetical protein